jgi:hypothetical protein
MMNQDDFGFETRGMWWPSPHPERAGLIGSRDGEHAARAMDLVLNVLAGYFVEEPELTPEQGRADAAGEVEPR